MISEPTPQSPGAAPEPPARRGRGVAVPGQKRPWSNWLIGFCAAALLLNGLIGQNGYFETRRHEQQLAGEVAKLQEMRAENRRLQARAQALKSDPATIEDAARRQLGLIKEGEVLFIITDTPSTPPPPTSAPSAPATPPAPSQPSPQR